jgi:hypothetical protein
MASPALSLVRVIYAGVLRAGPGGPDAARVTCNSKPAPRSFTAWLFISWVGIRSGALLSFSSAFWCFADVDISYQHKTNTRRYLYPY